VTDVSDPFDLTKVIQSRKFRPVWVCATLEQQGRMRLAATVIGDTPSAVINFRGQLPRARGDLLNGFSQHITTRQCTLTKEGNATLFNESAPDEGSTTASPLSPPITSNRFIFAGIFRT
jgi:hypothetical protein